MLPGVGRNSQRPVHLAIDRPARIQRPRDQHVASRAGCGGVQIADHEVTLRHRGHVGGDLVLAVVDDDQPEPARRHLQERRAVVVGVVPVRAAHVVSGNVVDVVTTEAALEHPGDVVARSLPGDVQTMGVEVRDVRVLERVGVRTRRLVGQQVAEAHDVLVAGDHVQCRPRDRVGTALLAIGPRGERLAVVHGERGLPVLDHSHVVRLRSVHIGPDEWIRIDDVVSVDRERRGIERHARQSEHSHQGHEHHHVHPDTSRHDRLHSVSCPEHAGRVRPVEVTKGPSRSDLSRNRHRTDRLGGSRMASNSNGNAKPQPRRGDAACVAGSLASRRTSRCSGRTRRPTRG